jgi:autotransporter-associated beta strand protein
MKRIPVTPNFVLPAIILAGALLLLTLSSLSAATWIEFSGDFKWGTAANWSPATVPNASGAAADFQVDVPFDSTILVGSDAGVGHPDLTTLKLGGTNGNSSIKLLASGATSRLDFMTPAALIEKLGDGNDSIEVGRMNVYNGKLSVGFAGGSGTLTFNCANNSIQEPAGAPSALVSISGPGTLILLNNNSHTGGTVIDGTTVQFNGDQRFGTAPASLSPANVTLGNGATLRASGNPNLSANRGLRLQGGGTANFATVNDNQVFTLNGPVSSDSGNPAVLVVNGPGTVVFAGANTWTGPTTVEGGVAVISTASSLPGPVIANNGGGVGAVVSSAGSSLALASLTLNGGEGTNALTFQLGTFGNPTAPLIVATNLTVDANRTNKVNIGGLGLTLGQFPLIQFVNGSGVTADKFEVNVLPPGVGAQILVEDNMVKLDVTSVLALRWNGDQSLSWDTDSTPNWLDVSGETPVSTVYSDGMPVQFDDGATSFFVDIAYAVSPAVVTVTNNLNDYAMSGSGTISGGASLIKQGSATLIMGALNDYSGLTVISEGTFQLGTSEVIPNGTGKSGAVVDGTLDLNGFDETINAVSGTGIIDNSAGSPSLLILGTANTAGSFAGYLTNSGGSTLALQKNGNQTLLLTGPNAHSGGTIINNGTLQVGVDNGLGTGDLLLNGGTVSSSDSSPRTLANTITHAATGAALGHAVNNGQLTFTGAASLSTTGAVLNINSDVVFASGSTGGLWNKEGQGALKLQGSHDWSGQLEIRNGALVLDGAGLTNSAPVRTICNQPNGLARFEIGPTSVLHLSAANANLRSGASGGNTTATNIVDIAGVVTMPSTTGLDGRLIAGQGSTIGFFNLLANGLIITRSVERGGSGYCEFNFDGGTLQAKENNPVYMSGYNNAFVRAGGLTMDTAGFDIGLTQDLLDGGGGGGLTKLGAGTLALNGNNTHTGTTTVSAGALGGSGIIAGPVLITGSAELAPGTSIGTLTVNNTVTVQGALTMELDRNVFPNADLLVANAIVGDGATLNIVNSGDVLEPDDTFDLFDGPLSGTFVATNLPALADGLSWDTSQLGVDGTIKVIGGAQPPPITYELSGNQLTLSWPGDAGWRLQGQTNSTAVGLSDNWSEITDAAPPFPIVINPANGAVFFRLIKP